MRIFLNHIKVQLKAKNPFIYIYIYIGDERKSNYKFIDFFWGEGWGELIITITEKRYSNLSSTSKENTNLT